MGSGRILRETPEEHNLPWGMVGVVSVPLKTTLSELIRFPKGHHQGVEVGSPPDVKKVKRPRLRMSKKVVPKEEDEGI